MLMLSQAISLLMTVFMFEVGLNLVVMSSPKEAGGGPGQVQNKSAK